MRKKFSPALLRMILKVFVIAVFVFVIFNVAARFYGVGYTASYSPMSEEVFAFGRDPQMGFRILLDLEVSFNPFLFPISHLSGYGEFSGPTEVLTYPEEDMGEIAALIRVGPEVTRNIPYFITVSIVAGLVIEEFAFHLSKLLHERKISTENIRASSRDSFDPIIFTNDEEFN